MVNGFLGERHAIVSDLQVRSGRIQTFQEQSNRIQKCFCVRHGYVVFTQERQKFENAIQGLESMLVYTSELLREPTSSASEIVQMS